MKNYKQFITGVIVGGVLLSGGNALANNAGLPSISNWVKYKINGEFKALPSGYTTLNHEGHTYVPTRFIAEELGADVEWDDKTNTVSIITTKVQEVEDKPEQSEKPIDETEDRSDDSDKYEELPVSKTIDGVRVEVYSVEDNHNFTKFYAIVKNTTENLVQLDQGTAYFKSDLKTYSNNDINGSLLYWKDTTWFSDLEEDKDATGYIMLPPVPDEERQGKFYVEVRENSLNGKTLKYEFDLKW